MKKTHKILSVVFASIIIMSAFSSVLASANIIASAGETCYIKSIAVSYGAKEKNSC